MSVKPSENPGNFPESEKTRENTNFFTTHRQSQEKDCEANQKVVFDRCVRPECRHEIIIRETHSSSGGPYCNECGIVYNEKVLLKKLREKERKKIAR